MFKDNAISVELNYHISIVFHASIALIFSFEVIILTKLRLSTFVISYSDFSVEFLPWQNRVYQYTFQSHTMIETNALNWLM